MPYQNRVEPDSTIVARPERGEFMGNRGKLHDSNQKLHHTKWQSNRWICCELHYKNHQRLIMSEKSYTELFFFDEATALCAGHRPCALCRREDYKRFLTCVSPISELLKQPQLDALLHIDRVQRHWNLDRPLMDIKSLPNGTIVEIGFPVLIWEHECFVIKWSGYTKMEGNIKSGKVLTPNLVLKALAGGYTPKLHSSFSRCQ